MEHKVKFPEMRNQLISSLNQIIETNINSDPIRIDMLDISFHFFLDDTNLFDDPESNIGYFILDKKEANLAGRVSREMMFVLDKYGNNEKNTVYLNKGEWVNVVNCAREALSYINK